MTDLCKSGHKAVGSEWLCESQGIREFPVRPCLLVILETIPKVSPMRHPEPDLNKDNNGCAKEGSI